MTSKRRKSRSSLAFSDVWEAAVETVALLPGPGVVMQLDLEKMLPVHLLWLMPAMPGGVEAEVVAAMMGFPRPCRCLLLPPVPPLLSGDLSKQ